MQYAMFGLKLKPPTLKGEEEVKEVNEIESVTKHIKVTWSSCNIMEGKSGSRLSRASVE